MTEVDYLSIAETANLLRVSQATIRRAIRHGDLPAVRLGRVIRVPRSALADLEKRQEGRS